MTHKIITISRAFGSGGRTIGKEVARRLGIPCYDKELVDRVSEESGFHADFIEEAGEYAPVSNSFLFNIAVSPNPMSMISTMSMSDQLFVAQTNVIRKLAEEGPCVIVGRCADYVLKGRKEVVRVFVHADDDFCLEQAMLVNSLSASAVKKKIAEVDEYHAKYYKYHTGKDWYDARNYDLSLNSGVLGFDATMNEILNYMEVRSQADQK